MNEKMFNQKLLKNLRFKFVHCIRVENAVSSGLPDINCCTSEGIEFWIESKVVRERRVGIRNSQVAWITVRTGFGGRVFLFAVDGSSLLIYHGNQVLKLFSEYNGYVDMVKPYAKIEKPWDFSKILEVCSEAPFRPKTIEMISNSY